jgi:hypothetical protein
LSDSNESEPFSELQKEAFNTIKRLYQESQNRLWLSLYWRDLLGTIITSVTLGGFALYCLFVTWNFSPNVIHWTFAKRDEGGACQRW